jgi:hypothetical protein
MLSGTSEVTAGPLLSSRRASSVIDNLLIVGKALDKGKCLQGDLAEVCGS